MRINFLLSVVVLFCLMQGCSGETVKRNTFETLQNAQQQRCLKTMEQGCSERESYDGYQQKRDELKRGE